MSNPPNPEAELCFCGYSVIPSTTSRHGWTHVRTGTDRCYPKSSDRSDRQLFALAVMPQENDR